MRVPERWLPFLESQVQTVTVPTGNVIEVVGASPRRVAITFGYGNWQVINNRKPTSNSDGIALAAGGNAYTFTLWDHGSCVRAPWWMWSNVVGTTVGIIEVIFLGPLDYIGIGAVEQMGVQGGPAPWPPLNRS